MQSAEAVTPAPTYGTSGELEQALHRAVLAERAVQHGEDDVDRRERLGHRARRAAAHERRCRRSPARARAARRPRRAPSAPERSISTRTTSSPSPASASATLRADATDTSCSLERPPESTAIAAAHGGGVCEVGPASWSWSSVGRRRGRRRRWCRSAASRPACVTSLPTKSVTVEPFSSGPLAGSCASTRPSWLGSVTSCVSTVVLKPASSISCWASASVSPVTLGTSAVCRALRDRDRDLRALRDARARRPDPGRSRCPSARRSRRRCARR